MSDGEEIEIGVEALPPDTEAGYRREGIVATAQEFDQETEDGIEGRTDLPPENQCLGVKDVVEVEVDAVLDEEGHGSEIQDRHLPQVDIIGRGDGEQEEELLDEEEDYKVSQTITL